MANGRRGPGDGHLPSLDGVVIGPTLAGLPSISVPVGFNSDGLPMGLQIIGPAQADHAVLQLAYAHEQRTRWVERRPPPCLLA